MLADQAQALRRFMMESSGRRARVIAVTSGKGGVGKTNLAVNLSVRLSQMGRRVILVDADMGTADADVLCDLRVADTLAHVVAGRRSLAQTLVQAPGGFRLVPGSSGLAQMAALSEFERARLIQQIHELHQETDLILIDTGAGVGPNVLGFVAAADQQLIVTTPEPTALTDAYALIKTAWRHRQDMDVSVLVNMAADAEEARGVFDRLSATCQRFLGLSIRLAGHVVHDARVPMAVRRRRPFVLDYPNADASQCIGRLAHRLDRHAVEPGAVGLMRRMALWLAG